MGTTSDMGARAGSCVLAALAGAVLTVAGGSLAAILFMHVLDGVEDDPRERLPRGGPGDVLLQPVPALARAGLAGPPLREQACRLAAPPAAGWERAYRSPLAAGGELVVRLEGDRQRVREVVLPRPAKPVTLEGLAGRQAWGPPASTSGPDEAQVSRWRFARPGGAVEAVVRWHGPRPGEVDEVRWTLVGS